MAYSSVWTRLPAATVPVMTGSIVLCRTSDNMRNGTVKLLGYGYAEARDVSRAHRASPDAGNTGDLGPALRHRQLVRLRSQRYTRLGLSILTATPQRPHR